MAQSGKLHNVSLVERAHKHYQLSQSLGETAAKFGVSKSSLYEAFKRNNLPMQKFKCQSTFPVEKLERMVADYHAGKSLYDIAYNYNVAHRTLRYWFAKRNVKLRNRTEQQAAFHFETRMLKPFIVARYAKNKVSGWQIAQFDGLGCSATFIYKTLHEAKVMRSYTEAMRLCRNRWWNRHLNRKYRFED